MSDLPAVEKIAGVVACAVGDTNGSTLELSGDASQARNWLSVTAFACNPLGRIGGLLRLGAPQGVSTKCADACWVASVQSGHALVRGQLARAEALFLELEDAPPSGHGDAQVNPIARQLSAGLLAGDAYGGLRTLKVVEAAATDAPSLRWAALIGGTRASAATGEGLDTALEYAKSALTIAWGLDAEARSIDTFELAGVEFQQGAWRQALAHTRTARTHRVNASDHPSLAGSWLLEDASLASKPLLGYQRIAADVGTMHQIPQYARTGAVPAAAPFEFLERVQAPPSRENEQLKTLSDSYPTIDQSRDGLGGHRLRTGQDQSARANFEALCVREDSTEEVRTSMLLALGCLATVDSRNRKSIASIRAGVESTPRDFRWEPPTPPRPVNTNTGSPPGFRQSDVAPPAAIAASEASTAAPGTEHRVAMFSGRLGFFGLLDLLEFRRSGQRTGTLLCSSTAGIGAIWMRRGRVTGAGSPKANELRASLLAKGIDTDAALAKLDDAEQDETSLIGGVLVKSGVATTAQVCNALRVQIKDAIKDLATAPDTPLGHAVPEIQVEVAPQEALLNIFKEVDETVRNRCSGHWCSPPTLRSTIGHIGTSPIGRDAQAHNTRRFFH